MGYSRQKYCPECKRPTLNSRPGDVCDKCGYVADYHWRWESFTVKWKHTWRWPFMYRIDINGKRPFMYRININGKNAERYDE